MTCLTLISCGGSDRGNTNITGSGTSPSGTSAPGSVLNVITKGITHNLGAITPGPGGLWFTEITADHPDDTAAIGLVSPDGTVTEFTGELPGTVPTCITRGPDANMWFTDVLGSTIGRIVPPSGSAQNPGRPGSVQQFPVRAGSHPVAIVTGPDGKLWFTEAEPPAVIGKIAIDGTVTEFSAGLTPDSHPTGLCVGPDGNLWFTESQPSTGGKIGRITTAGVITEFADGITPGSVPTRIVAGPDGNLWFTESGLVKGNRIGRITPGGVVTEFSAGITPGSQPTEIIAGPDGALWFTESNATNGNKVGRITISGVVTEFPVNFPATPISIGRNKNTLVTVAGVSVGPDNNIWVTGASGAIEVIKCGPPGSALP